MKKLFVLLTSIISLSSCSFGDSFNSSSSNSSFDIESSSELFPSFYKFNKVNDIKSLTCYVTPSTATDKRINWTSSQSSKIQIIKTNNPYVVNIKALSLFEDTVYITASSFSGSISKTCTVTFKVDVRSPSPVCEFYDYYGESFCWNFSILNRNNFLAILFVQDINNLIVCQHTMSANSTYNFSTLDYLFSENYVDDVAHSLDYVFWFEDTMGLTSVTNSMSCLDYMP